MQFYLVSTHHSSSTWTLVTRNQGNTLPLCDLICCVSKFVLSDCRQRNQEVADEGFESPTRSAPPQIHSKRHCSTRPIDSKKFGALNFLSGLTGQRQPWSLRIWFHTCPSRDGTYTDYADLRPVVHVVLLPTIGSLSDILTRFTHPIIAWLPYRSPTTHTPLIIWLLRLLNHGPKHLAI